MLLGLLLRHVGKREVLSEMSPMCRAALGIWKCGLGNLRQLVKHTEQSLTRPKIQRPLLAKGTKAAGLEFGVFLSIGSHCFPSYQAIF